MDNAYSTRGTLGFLLGEAHDTGLVSKTTHSGVVYGFLAATGIGFARQWYYLGKPYSFKKAKGSVLFT